MRYRPHWYPFGLAEWTLVSTLVLSLAFYIHPFLLAPRISVFADTLCQLNEIYPSAWMSDTEFRCGRLQIASSSHDIPGLSIENQRARSFTTWFQCTIILTERPVLADILRPLWFPEVSGCRPKKVERPPRYIDACPPGKRICLA